MVIRLLSILFILLFSQGIKAQDGLWLNVGLKRQITHPQPMTGLVLRPGNAKKIHDTYGQCVQLEYEYYLPCRVVKGCEEDGTIIYDWSSFDKELNDVASRGHQLVPRFRYEFPNSKAVDGNPGTTAVPDYIKQLPDYHETYSEDAGTYYADWSNEELQRFTLQFYADFFKRYAHDPRLAFLQVGFGHWSEYHIFPTKVEYGKNFPSLEYQKKFLLHISEVSDGLPWLISKNAGDTSPIPGDEELLDCQYGLFEDSFMGEYFLNGGYLKAWNGLGGRNRWQIGVIGGEVGPDYKENYNFLNPEGLYGHLFEDVASQYHVTFMGGSSATDNPNGTPERVKQASMATGYRFVVRKCATNGKKTLLLVSNEGIAPIYRDAYFAIGDVRSETSVKGLLPDEEKWIEIAAKPSSDGSDIKIVCDHILPQQEIEFEACIEGHDFILSVSDALCMISQLENNVKTEEEYEVTGVITSIQEISTHYGNATFVMADTKDAKTELTVFRTRGFNGDMIRDEQLLKVGDEVKMKGRLQRYVDGNVVIPEIAGGGQILSIKGNADSGDYTYDKRNAFGWGTCSDISGTPYQLDGGWHNGNPTYTVLYASGGDDRIAIIDAINNFDIVVLDGSKGDFVLSRFINLSGLKHKSILGRNNARLCTQWYITPELKQVLIDADLNHYSGAAGTGGTLSTGVYVGEECELHTRQTIIDYTGDETEAYRSSGIFYLDSSNENVIIRNLTFVGPGSVDIGGADLVSNYGGIHVWVDHCDFIDGLDGNLDSGKREGSDMFVTYSWNIFHYTDRSFSHQLSNGVGWDKGYPQYITYAYNIWGAGCLGRLPQGGKVYIHMLNNYYNCPGNDVAINIKDLSHALIEGNCAVNGVNNPFMHSGVDVTYETRGNLGFGDYNNASNTDQPIEVPYNYVCFPTLDVPSLLTGTHGAGPTLSDDDMVVPDGEPVIIQKTFFVIKTGETFKSGQTIELENITMTFGESGGRDFHPAQQLPLDEVFTAFTPGNSVSGNEHGGTFYSFVPQKDGLLSVVVKQNRRKQLFVEEDGIVLPDFNGITLDETHPDSYTFSFRVKAGSTYKLYCVASKLGLYGFIFNWSNVDTGILHLWKEEKHTGTRIFNLAGQRLSKPQKGINIIDGKKVVVK